MQTIKNIEYISLAVKDFDKSEEMPKYPTIATESSLKSYLNALGSKRSIFYFVPAFYQAYFYGIYQWKKLIRNNYSKFGFFGGAFCYGGGTFAGCYTYRYSPLDPSFSAVSTTSSPGFTYAFLREHMSSHYKNLKMCEKSL